MSEQENFIHQMIVSLRTQLLVMGASTEIAVDNMRNAIMKMDAPTAQAVIDGDDAIDLLENQIDSSSLSILARIPLPQAAAPAAAGRTRPAADLRSPENDHGYGAHRR